MLAISQGGIEQLSLRGILRVEDKVRHFPRIKGN
jgi:hypothetical protein